jgi:riboflavin biosynthesis pyrimidine reductase
MAQENPHQADFERYSREKRDFWENFDIPGLKRLDDPPTLPENVLVINDDFINSHMGGPLLVAKSLSEEYPTVEVMFAQSLPEEGQEFGNTEPPEVGEVHLLKAGDTDYFYYGNTSRLIVDGVLAGGNTARAFGEIRTLWHPKLVDLRSKLRADLGLPPLEHPHQIIVSNSGNLNIETDQMYNLEEVKTYVLTSEAGMEVLLPRIANRNVEVISMGPGSDLALGLRELKKRGIHFINAVGGRGVVTQLMDLRHENGPIVRGAHLTTAPVPGGVPNTPFYTGNRKLEYDVATKRIGQKADEGVVYQYLVFK